MRLHQLRDMVTQGLLNRGDLVRLDGTTQTQRADTLNLPFTPPTSPGGHMHTGRAPGKTNVLAIISLVTALLMQPVVSLIVGYIARSQIRQSGEDGDGLALAGIIISWVYVGFLLLVVVGFIVLTTIGVAMSTQPYRINQPNTVIQTPAPWPTQRPSPTPFGLPAPNPWPVLQDPTPARDLRSVPLPTPVASPAARRRAVPTPTANPASGREPRGSIDADAPTEGVRRQSQRMDDACDVTHSPGQPPSRTLSLDVTIESPDGSLLLRLA